MLVALVAFRSLDRGGDRAYKGPQLLARSLLAQDRGLTRSERFTGPRVGGQGIRSGRGGDG